MEKSLLIDEILMKPPSQWNENEWWEVHEGICKGYLKVILRASSTDKKPPEPFQPWPTSPLRLPSFDAKKTVDEPCLIVEWFKQHPDVPAMISCQCPKCTIHC